MRKVYVVGNANEYANWLIRSGFDLLFEKDKEKATLFLFTGGSDVNPALYGEKEGNKTYIDATRDIEEAEAYNYAKKNNIPCLGVCRGAQFLTVMNGGRLVQDVTNHAINGYHIIKTIDGKRFAVNSTHHQMMYPFDLKEEQYKIIAHSEPPISGHYLNGKNNTLVLHEKFVEPEIVYYPMTRCLCIQCHPEQMSGLTEGLDNIKEIFNKFYEEKL